VELKPKTERLAASVPKDVARAAEILREGGTVAFPTETVYGLGANALSNEAVAKIFAAKQRPSWDPLIVHICDLTMLPQISRVPHVRREASTMGMLTSPTEAAADPRAKALMEAFWPGPLTLLLPRSASIPDAVTAGRPLVGVRMPAHPVALELIRLAGVPIAAPSANLFGHTSPTTAAHVLADLDDRIDALLDGGPTTVGLESTVAGFVPDEETGYPYLMVYRAGAITIAMLETEIGTGAVAMYRPSVESGSALESLPSPGLGLRHYAPRARLILVRGLRSLIQLELTLVDPIDRAFDGVEKIGVMLPDGWNSSCAQIIFRWGRWHSPEILAQRLYAGLRDLDDRGATVIICPVPETYGIGDAIRDRLEKAAREK